MIGDLSYKNSGPYTDREIGGREVGSDPKVPIEEGDDSGQVLTVGTVRVTSDPRIDVLHTIGKFVLSSILLLYQCIKGWNMKIKKREEERLIGSLIKREFLNYDHSHQTTITTFSSLSLPSSSSSLYFSLETEWEEDREREEEEWL